MKKILILATVLFLTSCQNISPEIGDMVEVCIKTNDNEKCEEGMILHITDDDIHINDKVYNKRQVKIRIITKTQ